MFTSYHGFHSCHWLFQGFLISNIMVSIFDGELFIMLRSQSFNLYMGFIMSTFGFIWSTFGFIWFSW